MNNAPTAALAASAVLAGTLLVAPAARADISHAPSVTATDDYLIKAAVRMTWNNMSSTQRRTICAGFWINPSRMVNIIARPSIRSGVASSWRIKPIIRRFLVRAC